MSNPELVSFLVRIIKYFEEPHSREPWYRLVEDAKALLAKEK